MAIKSSTSKTIAIVFVVLTFSAIAGIVGLLIVYKTKISKLNPMPRPTYTTPTYPTGLPPDYRLPGNFVPESYEVNLQPHFYSRIIEDVNVNVTSPNQTMLFTGNCTVHIRCVQNTRTILLHSNNLTLSETKLLNRNTNEMITITRTEHHEGLSDFLELQLDDVLKEGENYSLFMAFRGETADSGTGLILSQYKEGVPGERDNAERFLVVTQMEPTNARRVFPCFDEPEMKAEFNVTIIHRRDTIALANWGMSESTVIDDEWKFTRFHTTKKMSTYLLAFSVSEFRSVLSSHERVKVQIYARPEAIAAGHADYAANITGRILKFFEDRFEIDFPQKKFDQIAIQQFSTAAMENWGLVTYGESFLLYQEGVTSSMNKEAIAYTIAHEVAHQWFGNLVTMKWWSETWLKEGFATYMSFLAVNEVEPEFHIYDRCELADIYMAFEEDTLAASHPLSMKPDDVQTRGEIHNMYDGITYNKGAAVLRMLEDLLSDRVFTDGLKMYLKAFQYGSTVRQDLWDYLEKAVNEDGGHIKVADVMNTWTTQIGFPVITINTTNGEAYQRHFSFNKTSDSNLVWHVPIRVKSQTSAPSLVWLETSSTVTKEEFISKSGEWILANLNCPGYFIVNYNPENWERLMTQLERDSSLIPVINRGQIVQDAFYLARAEIVNVTLALNATRFLRSETTFAPWQSAAHNLNYLVNMFDRSEVYGPMQVYLQDLVKGLYNFFRNDTDNSMVPPDHSLQLTQITAIKLACSNELPECVTMATTKFAEWMKNETYNNIHPNLRPDIYCAALAAGGSVEWDFTLKRFQATTDPLEKSDLQEALACTKKIWLLNRYLQYTLDPEVFVMDGDYIFTAIASNAAGHALAWNFLRAHWTEMNEQFGGYLLDAVANRFSTEFELEELRRFQMDHKDDPDFPDMTVEQAIEQTQVNILWVEQNKQSLLEWFQNQSHNDNGNNNTTKP
ncbi:aminopeptidase N-like [Genypterus blacodes]|uniref:aminopeptidase N-like n=1 Tax=Genypterus blacodes TaxID=154954 RepID=UPI003F75E328